MRGLRRSPPAIIYINQSLSGKHLIAVIILLGKKHPSAFFCSCFQPPPPRAVKCCTRVMEILPPAQVIKDTTMLVQCTYTYVKYFDGLQRLYSFFNYVLINRCLAQQTCFTLILDVRVFCASRYTCTAVYGRE